MAFAKPSFRSCTSVALPVLQRLCPTRKSVLPKCVFNTLWKPIALLGFWIFQTLSLLKPAKEASTFFCDPLSLTSYHPSRNVLRWLSGFQALKQLGLWWLLPPAGLLDLFYQLATHHLFKGRHPMDYFFISKALIPLRFKSTLS